MRVFVILLLLSLASGRGRALSSITTTTTTTNEEETGETTPPPFSPVAIGIAGGTGAGKSTLARSIYRDLGQDETVAYLLHDNYYKDITHLSLEERSKTNFDHPDSLDTALLVQHVADLKRGHSVEVPNYDFETHSRTSEVTFVRPKPIILVEGILIFADRNLVDLLDIKVFVEAESDVRLMRRIARDTSERGRSVHDIIEQYQTTVRPMHEAFVEPSKRVADIMVHNGINTVVLGMITNHLRAEAQIRKPITPSNTCRDDANEQDGET